MKNKSFGIALILMLLIAGGRFVRQAKAGQDPPIGPYTVINLPLEDLPQYDPGFFYNPIISGYPGGGSLQVLYVLKDPRDVPLATYGYWDDERGSIVMPNDRILGDFGYDETLTAILDLDPITINVYVRIQAPDDTSVPDPLFWSDEWGKRPSLVVPFDNVGLNQFGGMTGLGCAVPEYAADQKPYSLSPDIEGGDAVNKEGLYDPRAYAPPLPWYPYGEASLRPGEVREGWISCMSSDVLLDEIVINARHIYTEPLLPTPFPTFEAIEEDAMDDTGADEECVQVESFDDPECLEAECCTLVLIPDSTIEFMDDPVNESTAEVVETAESNVGEPQDIPYGSSIAWGFKKAEKIPENGLLVENADLTFSAGFGQEISDKGTVIFKSAYVTRTEFPSVLVDPDGSYHDYQLIALVRAEPHSLSADDLAGYELQGINLDLNIYKGASDPERNVVLRYSGFNQEVFYETGSALEGYATFSLEPNRFAGFGYSDELPSNLWLEAESQEEHPSGSRTKYPINGLNIRSYSLESQTSMCDVVDCQEVNDPNEEITAQVANISAMGLNPLPSPCSM